MPDTTFTKVPIRTISNPYKPSALHVFGEPPVPPKTAPVTLPDPAPAVIVRRRKGRATDDRNHFAEIRALLAEMCKGENWSAPTVAAELVERLRRDDPDLLIGFLEAQATRIIREQIVREFHTQRASNRATARKTPFREAVDRMEQTGDDTLLRTRFLEESYTLPDGVRKRLGSMRRPDLLAVAGEYERRASESLLIKAFMLAIAEKCGDKAVEEVYTEQQLAAMFSGLSS